MISTSNIDRLFLCTLQIPFIKEAIQMNNRPMSFFGSPWSAPAWLKTNNDLIGKGSIIGNPGGEYFKTWALYFAK